LLWGVKRLSFRGFTTDAKRSNLNVQLPWVVLLFHQEKRHLVSKYSNCYDYYYVVLWNLPLADQTGEGIRTLCCVLFSDHSCGNSPSSWQKTKQILCFLNSNEHLHFSSVKTMAPALIWHTYFFIYWKCILCRNLTFTQ
jgi:hypothetical protein